MSPQNNGQAFAYPEAHLNGNRKAVVEAWATAAPELAEWVRSSLVNRDDAFGCYKARKLRDPNDRTTWVYTRKRELKDVDLLKHFRGEDGWCMGLHSTGPKNTSRWLVVDIDAHGEDDDPEANWRFAKAKYDQLVALGLRPLLLDSNGAGGFHLWIIFNTDIATDYVYRFARWIVRDHAAYGLAEAPETFPKQGGIKPGGFGNWARLPGYHHTNDHWSRVWAGGQWFEGANAVRAIRAATGVSPTLIPDEAKRFDPKPKPKPKATQGSGDRMRERWTISAPRSDHELAREALEYLNPAGLHYDDWIRVGMGLHDKLGDAGLDLFDHWSRDDERYQGREEILAKFQSFTQGAGTKIGTVFKMATDAGWPGLGQRDDVRGNGKATVEPGEQSDSEGEDDDPPFDLGLVGTADFFAEAYQLHWIVKGVTVADQACVFGGPQKTLKTSIVIDQCISIGSGTPFLGRFEVPEPVPCMLISGESGRAVIQANAREICRARDIDPARVLVHWGFEPPQLCNPKHIDAVRKAIETHGFKFVVFDPLYLSLLAGNAGIDPKDMFQMGPLLADVANACIDAGATPELCHHFVKKRDDPWGPPEMAELAYAGVGQFMRQWLLTSRRERYNAEEGIHKLHFHYGGSAGHAGELCVDIDTGRIDDEFRGRKWDVTVLTPFESRMTRQQQQQAEAERKRAAKEQEKATQREQEVRESMVRVEALLHAEPGRRATARRIRDLTGWRKDRADHVLARMEQDGRIMPASVPTRSGRGPARDCPGFELTTPIHGGQ